MRVLLADDHSMVRDGLRPFLNELADDVEILEAGDLPEALGEADRAGAPDLALLDLLMPGMNGTEGIDAFQARFPDTVLVILSGQFDRERVLAAVDKGVRGYIPKTLGGQALVNALRLILAGDTYLPASAFGAPAETGEDADPAADTAAGEPAGAPAPDNDLPALSEREREILKAVVAGGTNKTIARDLDVQEITVKVHLRNVYRKIGAANRAQAVRIALEQGLV